MTGVSCMGGWCPRRNSCGHYHAEDRSEPAESLCVDEGGDLWVPVVVNLDTKKESK